MMGDREKQIKHVLLIISDSLPNCSDFNICLGKPIALYFQAFHGGASQLESEIPTHAHSCVQSAEAHADLTENPALGSLSDCGSLTANSLNAEKPCPLGN